MLNLQKSEFWLIKSTRQYQHICFFFFRMTAFFIFHHPKILQNSMENGLNSKSHLQYCSDYTARYRILCAEVAWSSWKIVFEINLKNV